ncbi:MAG TPA: Holliday junction resolvase RuvX [Candidatus Eremiobacteraceae bacterium]|nr:Holliday junction resolvase RuvX [Candidatus Eremiobacteraceae bacterium]
MSDVVLGLDVGTVRIGVAVSEGEGLPAMPLATIEQPSRAKAIGEIVRLAVERNAKTLVVGYPLTLAGERGPAALKMDTFIAELRKAFGGEVTAADERLTSAAANKRIRDSGLSGSKRRRLVDRIAAVEILDGWLARRGS